MDLTFSDQQQEIADLAHRILDAHCSTATLRQLEQAGAAPAADAWAALAGADLLGLALPEADGGSGLGLLDAAQVARQVGRYVAPVPYWATIAAALTLARWGTTEQRQHHLPGVANGEATLAVALWEPATHGNRRAPGVVATRDAGGYRLEGLKSPVPWASTASALLVPARTEDGDRLVVLVEPHAAGLHTVDEFAVNREPMQTVHFEGVMVEDAAVVGPPSGGDQVATWLAQHTDALLLATAVGVCEEALAITSRYVAEREQFGTPIGTFQAVAHRCADTYIDTEAIRLTTLQALWQLDAGIDAHEALQIAAFWACEGGQRVVHAAQHLHGGIGVDTDYPVHRYFRWAKVLELLLGGTHAALSTLGTHLAAEGDRTGSKGAASADETT